MGRRIRPCAALGRELEIAGLLSAIRGVENLVWVTADVHYCAAHFYDPAMAKFQDFDPFWGFVAGPIHTGTFGPNAHRPEGPAGHRPPDRRKQQRPVHQGADRGVRWP